MGIAIMFQICLLTFVFLFGITRAQVPFPVYRIREITFSGGVASATSYHSDHWRPENAFKRQLPVDNGWHIGPGKTPAQSPPVMIWYDFKAEGIRPAELSFQPAQQSGATQGAPSSYQFVGSNDAVCNDDATWTVLCEDLSDRAWRNYWEVRYCKVKPEMTEKFRCLGIRVLANRRTDGWTSLRNVRMWERIEAKSEAKSEAREEL